MSRIVKSFGLLAVVSLLPVPAIAQTHVADLHQRHRADLPEQVRSVPPARFDRADVARHVRRVAAVGAVDQEPRRRRGRCRRGTSTRPSASRNSRTIARSATRRSRPSRSGSTPARRRAIRRTCRRQGVAERAGLELREAVRADRARPDRQVAAVDAEGRRQRRVVEAGRRDAASPSRAGCARLKFVPARVKGRKITHHAIARLQQQETDALAANPHDANGNPLPGTFMEWAVGKQGEMMRPNSGKLMLPGAKIVWDIHYSNGGEDITDQVELGIYFYPKGQEPKFRQVLHLMGGTNGSGSAAARSVRRRHSAQHREGHRRLLRDARERPRRELPAAHAPARQGDVDGSDPAERPDPGAEPRGRLQLQLAQHLRLRGHAAPLLPKGTHPQDHRRGTTTPPPTSPTPIRTCGSATAIAPSTRWRTRGSTSPT